MVSEMTMEKEIVKVEVIARSPAFDNVNAMMTVAHRLEPTTSCLLAF